MCLAVQSDDRSTTNTRTNISHKSTETLVSVRTRDPIACKEFVREHGPRMLSVARRLFRCEQDSEDAVQDAFVSAFRALDAFEGNCEVSTWLHRIVVNSCLMKLRAQSRRAMASIDDLLPAFDEAGRHARPVNRWRNDDLPGECGHEMREKVRESIDRLPEMYRTVLILRDIGEFDTEQTACVLQTTSANVKVRLHRARMALRSLLNPHLEAAS